MKYNQPYGISDPNGSYVNGNPATGTMGSIPPAESIECDQREIVNLITKSSLTPTNADLTQLAQGIQTGVINYGVDIGAASLYAVTLAQAPVAYHAGMPIRMKVVNAPKGPSTINVNGLGPKPMMKRNNTPIQAFDFFAGDIVEMIYDGTNFQLIGLQPTPLLGANMTYYVATTGSDSNDGLTAGTPFLTIQKAINTTNSFNLNGYTVTIIVAAGTYGPFNMPALNGSGNVNLVGNSVSPGTTIINAASGGYAVLCTGDGYSMDGFTVTTPGLGPPGVPAAGIWVVTNGALRIKNINFGACGNASTAGSWWCAVDGGYLFIDSIIYISGGTYTGFGALSNGQLRNAWPTRPNVNITTPVTVGVWASASTNAFTDNKWNTITGFGNVTGAKYLAWGNGVVNADGAGANYYPGTTPGSIATGGQYV